MTHQGIPECSRFRCLEAATQEVVRPPTHAISHLLVISPPDPISLRVTLQASFHRIHRGLQATPTPLLSSLVASWRRTHLLARRRLLQSRMIWEIFQSQAPNKVLWAVPPPVDPAEQLLPRSYRCALFQSPPQMHLTAPDLPPLHRLGGPPLQLSHTSSPGVYVSGTLPVAQFLACFPLFSYLPPLQIDFNSFPPNFHSCRWPAPPCGPG